MFIVLQRDKLIPIQVSVVAVMYRWGSIVRPPTHGLAFIGMLERQRAVVDGRAAGVGIGGGRGS